MKKITIVLDKEDLQILVNGGKVNAMHCGKIVEVSVKIIENTECGIRAKVLESGF